MVVHTYNPSYSGHRERRITVQGYPMQKTLMIPSSKMSQAQWFMSIILATRETEVGRLPSGVGPGKNIRPYLKTK
jgi:hypothetical protein